MESNSKKHPNFFFKGNSGSWLYYLYFLGSSTNGPPSSTDLVWLGSSMQLTVVKLATTNKMKFV